MKPLSTILRGIDRQILNTVWKYQQKHFIDTKTAGKIEKLRDQLCKLTDELEKKGN